MSLEKTAIVDETIEKLSIQALQFMELASELWNKVMHKRLEPPKALLKKIKKLAKDLSETCEELP